MAWSARNLFSTQRGHAGLRVPASARGRQLLPLSQMAEGGLVDGFGLGFFFAGFFEGGGGAGGAATAVRLRRCSGRTRSSGTLASESLEPSQYVTSTAPSRAATTIAA